MLMVKRHLGPDGEINGGALLTAASPAVKRRLESLSKSSDVETVRVTKGANGYGAGLRTMLHPIRKRLYTVITSLVAGMYY